MKKIRILIAVVIVIIVGSIFGAIFHNIGQILAAVILTQSPALMPTCYFY